jgi:hypothetical protein
MDTSLPRPSVSVSVRHADSTQDHGKEKLPLDCSSSPDNRTDHQPLKTHRRPWGWTCNGVFLPLEVRPEMPVSYR